MSGKTWLKVIGIVCMSLTLLTGPVFAAEKPIKLGVMFVMSGKMGGYGKHGSQAVRLAMDEINAGGGILGRQVGAVFEDTKLQVDLGSKIANKFINEDKVDFIIGPTSSAVAVAVSKIATAHKKILVLTQAAANSMTDSQFSPYQFSVLSNAMMHSVPGPISWQPSLTRGGCASGPITIMGMNPGRPLR